MHKIKFQKSVKALAKCGQRKASCNREREKLYIRNQSVTRGLKAWKYTFIRKSLSFPTHRRLLAILNTFSKYEIEVDGYNNEHMCHEPFYACLCFSYSLISIRPIYYFDTWAIIWHKIVCWFMISPVFTNSCLLQW